MRTGATCVLVIEAYLMQYILVELMIMGEVQARRLAFWPWFVVAFLSVSIDTTVLGCQQLFLFSLETRLGGSGQSMSTWLAQRWFSLAWPQMWPRDGHAIQA